MKNVNLFLLELMLTNLAIHEGWLLYAAIYYEYSQAGLCS